MVVVASSGTGECGLEPQDIVFQRKGDVRKEGLLRNSSCSAPGRGVRLVQATREGLPVVQVVPADSAADTPRVGGGTVAEGAREVSCLTFVLRHLNGRKEV